MLSWLQSAQSESLEHARERARERAEQAQEAGFNNTPPSKDGLEVEEISAEEFMHLFQQQDKAA